MRPSAYSLLVANQPATGFYAIRPIPCGMDDGFESYERDCLERLAKNKTA